MAIRGARIEKRPRLASVGAQSNREEVMFGATFDGKVVRRLLAFVVPYRRRLLFGLAAVLVFTATQLAIPLIVSNTFDYVAGAGDAALTLLRATVRRLRRRHPRQLHRQRAAGRRGGARRRARAVRPAPRHVPPPAAGVAVLHGPDRDRPADVAPAGRRVRAAGVPGVVGVRGRRHGAARRHHDGAGGHGPGCSGCWRWRWCRR